MREISSVVAFVRHGKLFDVCQHDTCTQTIVLIKIFFLKEETEEGDCFSSEIMDLIYLITSEADPKPGSLFSFSQ